MDSCVSRGKNGAKEETQSKGGSRVLSDSGGPRGQDLQNETV